GQALLDPDRYLASSPPVMPAAIPSASAQARTLFLDNPGGPPMGAAPNVPNLPLRAPPSMIAGPEHGMQGPAAYAKTSAMPAAGPVGMALDTTSQQIAAMRRVSAAPGMPIPAAPTNQTMVIGTPPGYKDRPPRKVWPFVLVAVIAMGGAGAGIALATRSGD